MKILALLSFIILPFTLSAQWTKTAGPVETSTTTIEIAGSDLYLGTNGNGLFKSADNGATWSQVAAYPDTAAEQNINRVIYHYNGTLFTHFLYVATADHIYSSSDNGLSFQYADVGLPDTLKNYNIYNNTNGYVYTTAQSIDPVTFLATTVLYYYDDFHAVWQQVKNLPAGGVVTSVAALHDTLYCAVFGHGLYRTINSGFTWDSLNLNNGLLATNNVRLLATDGQKLYAVAYDNNNPVLYVTTNAASWTSTQLSFTGGNIITTIVASNRTVCLGSPGAIYISKDDGINFYGTTLPYYSINDAKFLGTAIIAADLGSGFLHTPDDSTWSVSNAGLNYSSTIHLAYQYNNVYAMDGYNTFHTSNHGNSWTEDTDRLFNMSAIARMGDKLIGFSKYGQNDLYSLNQGQTWAYEVVGGVGILVNDYIVDNENRQIYALGQADIRRSDDYGKTWKALFYPDVSSPHDTLFTSMAKVGTRIFATVTDPAEKLFYSNDDGNHWLYANFGYDVYHVVSLDTTFLIGTSNGIEKSTDGTTFNVVSGTTLFSTYANGSTVFNFKGPNANSIQYSTDHGATWTDISLPDSAGSVNDIIMDDTYLYAATNNRSVWRKSLSDLGITYTPDTTNNYSTVNVGVNLLANEKPVISIYPNPFTESFNVSVTTTATHYIDVKMYDVAGRCVQVLAQGVYEEGIHKFTASTTVPAGVYYVTTIVDGSMATKKVVRY